MLFVGQQKGATEVLSQELEASGYRTATCRPGREHTALVGEEPADVLVVDLTGAADNPSLRRLWQEARRDELLPIIVLLDSAGKERWKKNITWRVFFTRLLDHQCDGRQRVFVGAMDGHVRAYDADGREVLDLTVDGAPGLVNYPLATTLGLWQPDDQGRRKFVMPRYHHTFSS